MQRSPDVTEIELPDELKAELDILPKARRERSHQWSEKEDKCIQYGYAVGTHQRELAAWLGVSPTTLRKRAKELGLRK
jgi:hypothetical protein